MRVRSFTRLHEITYPESEAGEYRTQAIPRISGLRYCARLSCWRASAEIVEDVPMPNTKYGITSYFVISRVESRV